MNKKRLLKMADFVETIPRAQFDMGDVWSECGSTGCAMGWAAHARIFKGLRLRDEYPVYNGAKQSFVSVAQELFDISRDESRGLFNLRVKHKTPKQVARNIRRFVESNGEILP